LPVTAGKYRSETIVGNLSLVLAPRGMNRVDATKGCIFVHQDKEKQPEFENMVDRNDRELLILLLLLYQLLSCKCGGDGRNKSIVLATVSLHCSKIKTNTTSTIKPITTTTSCSINSKMITADFSEHREKHAQAVRADLRAK
jgi:hypothetical protein